MNSIAASIGDFSYAFWFLIPSTFLNSFRSFKTHASNSIWNFIDVLIAICQKTLFGLNNRSDVDDKCGQHDDFTNIAAVIFNLPESLLGKFHHCNKYLQTRAMVPYHGFYFDAR